MARYKQRTFNKEQQAVINRMMNPRTADDLDLALKNPNSPVSKMLAAALAAHEVEQIVLERIIERFIFQQIEITQKEKEEFMRYMLTAEAIKAEQIRKQIEQSKPPITYVDVFKSTLREINILLLELPAEISQLQTYASKLRSSLHDVNEHKSRLEASWPTVVKAEIAETLAKMSQSDFVLSGANGVIDFSSANGRQLLTNVLEHAPAPTQVMRVVMGSHVATQSQQTEIDPAIPLPPPPPPPSLPSKTFVGHMASLVTQIKLLGQCAETENMAFKDFVGINKPALAAMPEFAGIKTAHMQAAELEQETIKLEGQINYIDSAIQQKESFLRLVQDRSNELAESKTPRPRSPGSPSNSF